MLLHQPHWRHCQSEYVSSNRQCRPFLEHNSSLEQRRSILDKPYWTRSAVSFESPYWTEASSPQPSIREISHASLSSTHSLKSHLGRMKRWWGANMMEPEDGGVYNCFMAHDPPWLGYGSFSRVAKTAASVLDAEVDPWQCTITAVGGHSQATLPLRSLRRSRPE